MNKNAEQVINMRGVQFIILVSNLWVFTESVVKDKLPIHPPHSAPMWAGLHQRICRGDYIAMNFLLAGERNRLVWSEETVSIVVYFHSLVTFLFLYKWHTMWSFNMLLKKQWSCGRFVMPWHSCDITPMIDHGWRSLNYLLHCLIFSIFKDINALANYWIPHLYLTGVTTA